MSQPCPPDWENEAGDERPHESQLAKRPRHSGCCDDTQELLKEMLKKQHKQNELLQKQYQGLQEKMSSLEADMIRFHGYLQQTAAPRMLSDQHCGVALQLKFLNSCKNDKYSTRIIEADDGGPLKVAICGNNKIIACEPFSSMRVRVVPIHCDFDNDHAGQWTEDYFRSKIVNGRPGRENFLSGDLYIWLQDGVGYLNGAKFQDNSSFVASKKVKLGVMVADQRITQRIQEGITEPFAVKDIRGFSAKKNIYPAPRDAVHKLSRIAMNGDRRKFLEEKGIKTVEDFRCAYRKSPQDLRKILGKISDQEWDKLVKHAFKENPRPAICCNCIEERNVHDEHETFSRKGGSCYLQRSCSTQESPAPQPQLAEQLQVQVSQQQISRSNNEQSSGASLENLPCILAGIQTSAKEQLSGIENEYLQFSSMDNNVIEGSISLSQQCHRSSECCTMLAGNALPQVNSPVNNDLGDVPLEDFCKLLFGTETELMEEDVSWVNDFTEDSDWVDSCSPFKQIRGCSYISEEASITYTGSSPASEIGSRSYRETSPSPASGVGGRSSRGFSFSPANRARGRRCTRFSPSPVRGADKGR